MLPRLLHNALPPARRAMPPPDPPRPPAWHALHASAAFHSARLAAESRRRLHALSARSARSSAALRRAANTLLNHPGLTSRLSPDYVRGGLEFLGAAAALSALAFATYRGLRVYRTVADLPPRLLRGGLLRGTVVSVRDGDGLRLAHRPLLRRLLTPPPPPRGRDVADRTIAVRLAAVDAPECAALGRAQPFGPPARDWLRAYVLGRHVSVRIHAVDQYRRVIATVTRHARHPLPRALGLGRRNVSLELTRAGYATLYEGAGAQYGGKLMKSVYMAAEEVARRRGVGMWADRTGYVSPMEFKKAARMGKDALAKLEKRTAHAAVGKRAAKAGAKTASGKGPGAVTKRAPGGKVGPADEHDSLLQSLFKFAAFSYQFLRRYR